MVSVRVGEGRENEGKLLGGWRISEDVFGWEAPQEVDDARWSVRHQVFPTESWSSRKFCWSFFSLHQNIRSFFHAVLEVVPQGATMVL